MSEIILVENLVKEFGNKRVIDKISFKIKEGEIFGLLGPSGAGKTTIIKLLTGQLIQNEGIVKVFDTNNDSFNDTLYSKIGMVMDNSGLYERLNCYDNLLLFCRLYNVNKNIIKEVLEKVELLDSINKPVKNLSKGMKQRLIIARSIINNPSLLFLDEPTSGLDPATSRKIHDLLFELKANGVTIFLTTHNMEEATKMCDNVALLNFGNIVEYGSPNEICRRHNINNIITIVCKDNSIVTLKNNIDDSDKIYELFKAEKVLSIHSSEPTLETVFIELTGKELV